MTFDRPTKNNGSSYSKIIELLLQGPQRLKDIPRLINEDVHIVNGNITALRRNNYVAKQSDGRFAITPAYKRQFT